MGAWIEIIHEYGATHTNRVAPRVGAWIEIKHDQLIEYIDTRRAPRGRVD